MHAAQFVNRSYKWEKHHEVESHITNSTFMVKGFEIQPKHKVWVPTSAPEALISSSMFKLDWDTWCYSN
jgi:hypothetical protein